MSKSVGQVLAVMGSHLTIEVDPGISDLHIRHDGITHTVGQPGTYLIVEGGHDKHLVLVTTVRKSQWTANDAALFSSPTTSHLPRGNFPYLPSLENEKDRAITECLC